MSTTDRKWYKLDNAATIVPSTARGNDTRVFRIVCELTEEVDEALLQRALDETTEEYPHVNVVLRKGLFWYYLDGTELSARVEKENRPACDSLYIPGRRSLMYRVSYFHRRVNLEMFHVLADGTGGLVFFRRLIENYLTAAHGLSRKNEDTDRASAAEHTDDAFRHFYGKERSSAQLRKLALRRAYHIRQEKDDYMLNHLLEVCVSAKAFVALAHRRKTTAGVLMVAMYIRAVAETMSERDKKYPVVVSVPVNLRQYFPSATMRNFFGVIAVAYDAREYDGTLEGIVERVREAFAAQLHIENIRDTMNGYSALEHNIGIKFIPLFIKDKGISFFSGRTRRGTTSLMSNLGVVSMDEAFAPYIDRFSGFMSSENVQICAMTYEDKLTFGAVSAYQTHGVLMRFFRELTSAGLHAELGTNDYDA